MKVVSVEREVVEGRMSVVTTVECDRGIGIAVMPVLSPEGEAARRERIRAAFSELLAGCVRERGEEWVRERIGR